MVYLKRGYNRAIFDRRRSTYNPALDYDRLSQTLSKFPFVKTRRDEQGELSFTLHDKFQDMMEKHGRGDLKQIADELYEDVVEKWYPEEAIPQAQDSLERNLLQAEHLGYVLERDPGGAGYELYKTYFAEAERTADVELAELIWSEASQHLDEMGEDSGYALCRDQADWFFKTGQNASAANIYKLIAEKYSDPLTRRLFAVTRLGDAFGELGRDIESDDRSDTDSSTPDWSRIRTARQAFQIGLVEARKVSNSKYQLAFNNRLGQLEEAAGNWQTAKELYEAAIFEDLPADEDVVEWAEVSFRLAVLEARMGSYSEAEARCRTALTALSSHPRAKPQNIANAYFYLAQIERYSDHQEMAEEHYDEALKQAGDQLAFKVPVLQGRGANRNDLGARQRQKNISTAIKYQKDAFEDINESLALCRELGLNSLKADGLRRMGRVFRELYELEAAEHNDKKVDRELARLQKTCAGFRLSEEGRWRAINRLLPGPAFETLDLLGKAQRLFEVGYLEADEVNQYHESLDGITEAAQVALKRGHSADVRRYTRLAESLRVYDYQGDLFIANMGILLSHLSFDEGRFDEARKGYGQHFITLARIGGYARKRLDTQFQEFEIRLKRVLALTPAQKREFCQQLEAIWVAGGMKTLYAQMIFKIRALSNHFL